MYNIPEEKKAALAILDKELGKGKGAGHENEEADNKLDSTLNWLRKRQTDTVALENRQMCRLWDIDLMADEMERLEEHSVGRDKTSAKLKKDTLNEHKIFGHDDHSCNKDLPNMIQKTDADLNKQRKVLENLKKQQKTGCIRLGMEPDKACKDLYTQILAKDIQLN